MPTANATEALKRTEMVVVPVPILSDVVIADDLVVPSGIVDLPSFRRWAQSDDFPKRGRIDYYHDRITVDLSMEQLRP